MGKAKAEPESRKTAFKSAAFHLILPFMGYFKGVCLTTIDCEEHSLLKMVGYLWSEWDPEKPISKTELSSKFRFSGTISALRVLVTLHLVHHDCCVVERTSFVFSAAPRCHLPGRVLVQV